MAITRTDSIASSVLIIERDPLMLTAMGAVLNNQGYHAVLARTEEVAMESIEQGRFDVIVLSIDDVKTGCDFASRLRRGEALHEVPIIFLVPEQNSESSIQLASQGGLFSLLKPIDPYRLIELVDKAMWLPHVAKRRIGSPNGSFTQQKDWVTLSD